MSKMILIKEDIYDEDRILLIGKGELGEFLVESDKKGYIFIRRLKNDSVIEIPYARGFVQIINKDTSDKLKIALEEEISNGLDYD